MKLATLRLAGRTQAVRVDADIATELDAPDVGTLLEQDDWRERAATATGRRHDLSAAEPAPLVTRPGKIVCVGLNYRTHILEMGRDLPTHPTLFAKYTDALIGAHDAIHHPAETDALDWEAELGVVIGASVRRADEQQAAAAIAGFTVVNDVTCRDWQFRTREWLQGKTWEHTTPVGPVLVTPDELPGGVRPVVAITCSVDQQMMQADTTGDLVFDPVALVQYVSTMVRLAPGDLIATGTPGGVGHARTPSLRLQPGHRVITEIEGIGRLDNLVVTEPR
ncbi:fumarylacetoacetate hydrolase family protein [Williamsia sp. CHRR-6]|uniref:fumarylacetoacetate hydrolase family protein n=1 Tax=Williamsia sp. CHRR-6 TaxID=2835871 RepID=UPI001BDAA4F5|nr:fumarylacetoacetate hydrolase family protein [Williamsia sp. CHRR-6]MBT0566035.1 fumarylacetoacetate hydrolase family protein [Williamsia sp. CHRR-6]